MYYFCTYFDSNYTVRALALLESLEKYCDDFKLFTLCLDEKAYIRVRKIKNCHVIAITLKDVETAFPELVETRSDRSKLEYYYTCGPSFIQFVTQEFPEADLLTYLDSDLYFFGSPKVLFDELGDKSVGVMAHHLPENRGNQWQGIYNVGWITFRMDNDGKSCLETWRTQCIDWCYERYENGKYADQLYLDKWPESYKGFYEFKNKGANLAAWNVGDYQYRVSNGRVLIDEDPLVFYHFHGFKKITKWLYDTNLFLTLKPINPVLKKYVFTEYIRALERYDDSGNATASVRRYRPRFYVLKCIWKSLIAVVFRQYLFVFKNRIF